MKVRLAFSVAAHLEPEILIVDEVLAVGDAEFQSKCLGKMQDVASHGRTVLFVSHNMAAMRSLCRTGLLLNRGRIEFLGSVDACTAKYSSDGAHVVNQWVRGGVGISASSAELLLGQPSSCRAGSLGKRCECRSSSRAPGAMPRESSRSISECPSCRHHAGHADRKSLSPDSRQTPWATVEIDLPSLIQGPTTSLFGRARSSTRRSTKFEASCLLTFTIRPLRAGTLSIFDQSRLDRSSQPAVHDQRLMT